MKKLNFTPIYTINKYNICTNPDREIIYQDKLLYLELRYANNINAWSWGYRYQLKGSGIGCGMMSSLPSFIPGEKLLESKESCKVKGLKFLLDLVNDYKKHPGNGMGKAKKKIMSLLHDIALIQNKKQIDDLKRSAAPKEISLKHRPGLSELLDKPKAYRNRNYYLKGKSMEGITRSAALKQPRHKIATGGARKGPGRNIKSKFARTEILKIRTSLEHRALLDNIIKEFKKNPGYSRTAGEESNVSQADIIERALEQFAGHLGIYITN